MASRGSTASVAAAYYRLTQTTNCLRLDSGSVLWGTSHSDFRYHSRCCLRSDSGSVLWEAPHAYRRRRQP